MISHRIAAGDGVPLVLYRLDPARGGRPAVLLIHGAFSSHTVWLRGRHASGGLGQFLDTRGYDVWLADLRNHGASGREPERRTWRFEDWIRRDAPALLARVRAEIGDRPLAWIGHSAAGVVGLCVLARAIENPPVASLVAFGAPGPAQMGAVRRLGAFIFRSTALLLGYFPARALRFGPENEGARVFGDWMGWNLAGRWLGDDGFDYLEALTRVRTPYLAVAGGNDRLFSPPFACRQIVDRIGADRKELLIAPGFDHKGLLLDAHVGDAVWPRVADWLAPTPSRP